MHVTTPISLSVSQEWFIAFVADSYVEIDGSDWLLFYHCFFAYDNFHLCFLLGIWDLIWDLG